MSLALAIADARRNCERRGAVVILTLRSGVQFQGRFGSDIGPADVHIQKPDGGWVTVLTDEIAAVEVVPT